MSFQKCVSKSRKGDYVYAAISVTANQWAFERELHYIFKIGRASASYDRLKKLNEGWAKKDGRGPPLLRCTDWEAIDCWPTDGRISSEVTERHLKMALLKHFNKFPWKLKCPDDLKPHGATEVYQLAQTDFDDVLIDIIKKANDPTGEIVMRAVAHRIRGLVEEMILPAINKVVDSAPIAK